MVSLRVLVVDDHLDIAANIGEFLEARQHRVEFAYDGRTGLELASETDYDALIIDVNMPGMSGFELSSALRQRHVMTPILMLTARDTLDDKLEGFESGADDYLTKPFALEELAARLVALTRRGQPTPSSELRVGDLQVDPRTNLVVRAGKRIDLNPMSMNLLVALLRESPAIVSRAKLENVLWGDEPPLSDALRSQIYVLRRAIDRDFDTPLLHTIHGVGYRLACDRG